MIELKNINKSYKYQKNKSVKALDSINLKLPSKGLIFITGKSGSGKSTLLNVLGLLDRPDSGQLLFNNQDMLKYKEKEITNYRNSLIGFIFQDYNLLEELNVYENLELSLNLKNSRKSKEELDKILAEVDLYDVGYKKVNELSGGEQQRVAIARSLVKNPQIILADEPTGNLDSINSQKIFKIFKKLANKCLVVVVSHDKESAIKYGDGIIELQDGKIVSDSVKLDNKIDKMEKTEKSHINFLKRFKLAWKFLKVKKFRIIVTSIVISIAFALFAFSLSLNNFDSSKLHAETMAHENENEITIKKSSNINSVNKTIFSSELDYITSKINSKYVILSKLYSNDYTISYDGLRGYDLEYDQNFGDNAFYDWINNHEYETFFITYSSSEIEKMDIIGRIPKAAKEILIPEITAEFMMAHNFTAYYYNELEKYPYMDFTKANTKEELIGQKLWIGGHYLVISGIVKDPELEKYYSLKEESYSKMEKEPTALYKEFTSNYKNKLLTFVINENFYDVSEFAPNNRIDLVLFKSVVKYDEKDYYNISNFATLANNVNCYNGIKESDSCQVNEGEIIITRNTLYEIYKEEINDLLEQYINKAQKEYDKAIAKREQMIQEQEKLCIENNECDNPYIPEVEEVDTQKIENDVYEKIIKEHEIIGKSIDVKFSDEYGYLNAKENNYSLKIVGVSNESDNLVNSDTFKSYLLPNKLTWSVQITEDNENKMENIFRTFKEDSKFMVYTKYSDSINSAVGIINSIKKVSNYISLGLLIFSIVLFVNFISSSLNYNKKKVGILRSLGASISDVVHIFALEGIIIGSIVFIIANILAFIGINLTNKFISQEIKFYLQPISFSQEIIITILLVLIITIIISLIVPIIKLGKEEPINLINAKK